MLLFVWILFLSCAKFFSDLQRIRSLLGQTESDDELKEMLQSISAQKQPIMEKSLDRPKAESVTEFLKASQRAILEQDDIALTAYLKQASVGLSQPVLLEEFIGPLMRWVGEAWHEGTLRVAQEHIASASVRAFLIRLRHSQQITPGASTIGVATPAGESHEIGALMASVAANAEGWRTLYFGPSLPASELAHAAQRSNVRAVALSVVRPSEQASWIQELLDLRQFLPDSISMIIGGLGASANRLQLESPGLRCVNTLGEFQLQLRKIAA